MLIENRILQYSFFNLFLFATNIIIGNSSGKSSLRRAMYTKALEGNVVMQIWLSKQYLGMKERVETSEEAKPLPWID